MADKPDYKTVWGEAFGIKQSDKIEARTFAVRRVQDDMIANCTLWDNSHGHIVLENGDPVVVNGKYTRVKKQQGDGFWHNISVGRIAVLPMDAGIRDDTPTKSDEDEAGDEPDVL